MEVQKDYRALSINSERLERNIQALAKIGMNSEGGIDRAFGSEADKVARQWLRDYWKRHFGLEAITDPIANMWVTKQGEESLPPIVIGSHHDAVPNGGKYDGALGVLIATEIMETIIELGMAIRHPLSVVSFTGEEPNPFNVSTLGSKVATGILNQDKLMDVKHRETGMALKDELTILKGNFSHLSEAVIEENQIAAFIECHIEQGKRLEDRELPIGVVSGITGIYREQITVHGEANHAGTTGMNSRKDAFLAGSEYALAIEAIILEQNDSEIAGTIGYAKVAPNEANIIAETMTMIMDVRISDAQKKAEIREQMEQVAKSIEEKRHVTIQREVILDQPFRPIDQQVMTSLGKGIDSLGESTVSLVSMAGHDASNMALVTRSGMIFVRSKDGKSHCKEEFSTQEDIEKCANAMLYAVLDLDKELDK